MQVIENGEVNRIFQTKTSGWRTEAEFLDFIGANAKRIAEEIIGRPYVDHKQQWFLRGMQGFGPNRPHIDLMIMTEDGARHGIECKFPKGSFSDLSRAMSQLLGYGALAESYGFPLETLWLFTTHYDEVLRLVIERYKLPIRVVVFSRDQHAELICG
jgi:hypothetical protein